MLHTARWGNGRDTSILSPKGPESALPKETYIFCTLAAVSARCTCNYQRDAVAFSKCHVSLSFSFTTRAPLAQSPLYVCRTLLYLRVVRVTKD